MSHRCLTPATLSSDSDDDHDSMKQRTTYLESMFMCVTPVALTPLATMMYQKFKAMCPEHLQEVKEYDEKKVHCSIESLQSYDIAFTGHKTWYLSDSEWNSR